MRSLIQQDYRSLRSIILTTLFAAVVCSQSIGQVTKQERASVSDLASRTREAGQLFTAGELDKCSEAITKIQQELVSMLEVNSDPAMQRLAKPIYEQIANAHSLLELEAIQMQPLPEWEKITAPKTEQSNGVSFREDIAPWLVQRCGNCHIDRRNGNFSLATFADLRRGTPAGVVVFPGDARSSRLLEVLENGDMPRGGGQVTTQQTETLKQWINAGALPDKDLTISQPLRELVITSGGANSVNVGRATGDETVSFTNDVVPILLENCNGCHIDGQRPSGNLRMDTLAGLLRGGDTGQSLVPGKPAESLFIQKIKGEAGQRMPAGGRPALSDQQIETLSTWVSEGAHFDGSTATASIREDSQRAWARQAGHQELFEKRKSEALANWKRVSPNLEPTVKSNDSVIVLGDAPDSRTEEALASFTAAIKPAREALRLPDDTHWLPGGLTVFALNARYQYSEFGQMIEQRELPQSWQAHWNRDVISVYATVLLDDGWNDTTAPQLALLTTVGSYLGSFTDVPYWFAEGVGRNAVAANYRRDAMVTIWQQSAPRAYTALKNTEQLLRGDLNEETSALVGMGVTSVMLNRANRKRFETLLEEMRSGSTFDAAMRASFGPVDVYLKSVIGR